MAIQYSNHLDRTFHALGDASRREILESLRKKPRSTAGELVALFGSSQPTISKHLKVLEQANLVKRHREGRYHYFSLSNEGFNQAEQWMARHMAFWEHNLDRLDKLLDGNGEM